MEKELNRLVNLVIRDGESSGDENKQTCVHLIPQIQGKYITFKTKEDNLEEIDHTRVKAYAIKLRKLMKEEL